MKDIVITSARIRKELFVFLICFAIAFILNIISIIVYNTEWKELFTQLLVVIAITVVLYVLSIGIRGLIFLVRRIINKKNK